MQKSVDDGGTETANGPGGQAGLGAIRAQLYTGSLMVIVMMKVMMKVMMGRVGA